MMSSSVFLFLKCISKFLLKKRYESTMGRLSKDEIINFLKPPITNLSNVICEAEKVVGYPLSFINFKCLESDEFNDIAVILSKLVGSDRLVMQKLNTNIYKDSKCLDPWGLITLLLSQSVKTNAPALLVKKTKEHQCQLAEAIELIRIAYLIHQGIINIPFEEKSKDKTAIFDNKIAILLGDYLLVTANGMLANLQNSEVLYLISTASKDLAEGVFFGEKDEQNMPLPGKPKRAGDDFNITFDTKSITVDDVLGKPIKEWTARSLFNGVSLLGRGCQSAMILAKQISETKNNAFNFGCHVGLAWQAASELRKLSLESKRQFCLASAPVLFALESNPDLYKIIDIAKNDVRHLDYEDLKINILKTEAVNKTKMLYEHHVKKAIAYIDSTGQNESVDMIKKLINTI